MSIHRSSVTDHCSPIAVHQLGLVDYETMWKQMRTFTSSRTRESADEIWCAEHPPVYTLGIQTRPENLPSIRSAIPVVQSDRGGQITYHGPGQVVMYPLLDLRRHGLGVRALVRKLEDAVIALLADYGVEAHGNDKAPGVYVGNAKIGALGLRIRNGCSYHGLSLNVDMDLTPFAAIHPCGHPGLRVTQARDCGIVDSPEFIANKLAASFAAQLRVDPS